MSYTAYPLNPQLKPHLSAFSDALSAGRTSLQLATLNHLRTPPLPIAAYPPLTSPTRHLLLNLGSSLPLHLTHGPLLSSLAPSDLSPPLASLYTAHTALSHPTVLQLTPLPDAFAPNKFTFLVTCLQLSHPTTPTATTGVMVFSTQKE
jgi:hypothetical protein